MDPEKHLALELALDNRLRVDLDALAVRPYAYYKEAALKRAAGPGPVGRLFSFVRVGATILVVVVGVAAALAVAFVLRESRGLPGATSSPSMSISPTPAAGAAGAITGRVEYPAEGIPPLTVYAISTTDQRVWYSVDVPRFPNPSGTPPPPGTFAPGTEPRYTITGVAPGTYYVLAYRNDGQTLYPGGYTQAAVSCRGPQPAPPPPACNDHSLVPVTVITGQTVSGIDVTDWVVQPPPSIPPRPAPR
jgi:hypothetical protein